MDDFKKEGLILIVFFVVMFFIARHCDSSRTEGTKIENKKDADQIINEIFPIIQKACSKHPYTDDNIFQSIEQDGTITWTHYGDIYKTKVSAAEFKNINNNVVMEASYLEEYDSSGALVSKGFQPTDFIDPDLWFTSSDPDVSIDDLITLLNTFGRALSAKKDAVINKYKTAH